MMAKLDDNAPGSTQRRRVNTREKRLTFDQKVST